MIPKSYEEDLKPFLTGIRANGKHSIFLDKTLSIMTMSMLKLIYTFNIQ